MDVPIELPLLLGSADGAPFSGSGEEVPTRQWLAHPDYLKQAVRALIESGAGAVCAPTFLAARRRETDETSRRLMEITLEAAEGSGASVGGTLGPSGLTLSPENEADFDDLYELYRKQVRTLAKSGAVFFVLERQTSLADMRAALLAARTTNLPVLADIAVDAGGCTPTGLSLLPALITLQAMGADAVGLGGPLPDEEREKIFRKAFPHACVPLYYRIGPCGTAAPEACAEALRPILDAGVRLIAGGPESGCRQFEAVGKILGSYQAPQLPAEPDSYAASIEQEAFFLGEDLAFSDPIPCTSSLEDDLIDLDDEQVSVALVDVTCLDDAVLLGQCSSMTKLPIAVHTESLTVLDAALRYFQGRMIIDSACLPDRAGAEPIAAKYGAIIY